jgi:hypothetical protein
MSILLGRERKIMKPKSKRPNIVILVIYKTSEGDWRGFCSPYDVSCNGSTKKGTLESLKKLVSLYEEGLKKYEYPRHLSIKTLSDPEDERIFNKALEIIAEIETRKLTKSYYEYQEQEFDHAIKIRNSDHNFTGLYYHQPVHAT